MKNTFKIKFTLFLSLFLSSYLCAESYMCLGETGNQPGAGKIVAVIVSSPDWDGRSSGVFEATGFAARAFAPNGARIGDRSGSSEGEGGSLAGQEPVQGFSDLAITHDPESTWSRLNVVSWEENRRNINILKINYSEKLSYLVSRDASGAPESMKGLYTEDELSLFSSLKARLISPTEAQARSEMRRQTNNNAVQLKVTLNDMDPRTEEVLTTTTSYSFKDVVCGTFADLSH